MIPSHGHVHDDGSYVLCRRRTRSMCFDRVSHTIRCDTVSSAQNQRYQSIQPTHEPTDQACSRNQTRELRGAADIVLEAGDVEPWPDRALENRYDLGSVVLSSVSDTGRNVLQNIVATECEDTTKLATDHSEQPATLNVGQRVRIASCSEFEAIQAFDAAGVRWFDDQVSHLGTEGVVVSNMDEYGEGVQVSHGLADGPDHGPFHSWDSWPPSLLLRSRSNIELR